MAEHRCHAGVGEVVGRHIHRLHGGNGAIFGRGNAFFEGAHISGQRRLVSGFRRYAPKKGGYLRPGLDKPVHIVDEKNNVLQKNSALQTLFEKTKKYMIIKEYVLVEGENNGASGIDYDGGTLIKFDELIEMDFIKTNAESIIFIDKS